MPNKTSGVNSGKSSRNSTRVLSSLPILLVVADSTLPSHVLYADCTLVRRGHLKVEYGGLTAEPVLSSESLPLNHSSLSHAEASFILLVEIDEHPPPRSVQHRLPIRKVLQDKVANRLPDLVLLRYFCRGGRVGIVFQASTAEPSQQ